MCELFGVSAKHPTRVTFRFHEFAIHGGGTAPNADGWGVAFQDPPDVRRIREPAPAVSSPWVKLIERTHLEARMFISHVREASVGHPELKNTHPFTREMFGRMHTMAHNGTIKNPQDDKELQLGRYEPVGDTDSEYVFCALLSKMQPLWADGAEPSVEQRLEVFAKVAEVARKRGPANFLYSDGTALFVHAHKRHHPDGSVSAPGLNVLFHEGEAARHSGHRGVDVTSEHSEQELALVASVPLSEEDWRPLKEGSVHVFAAGKQIAGDAI
jgi:predicted glutamine amidotransferase